MTPGTSVDVMAIIENIFPEETKNVRGQSKRIQRISIRDETHTIQITVWEDNL